MTTRDWTTFMLLVALALMSLSQWYLIHRQDAEIERLHGVVDYWASQSMAWENAYRAVGATGGDGASLEEAQEIKDRFDLWWDRLPSVDAGDMFYRQRTKGEVGPPDAP